ncbi:MAG: hypothetical protein QNL62_24105 [Gammaproteobacteria bacterium]|nr:hypothetical protein [Gammaproteobacteria bacterium]
MAITKKSRINENKLNIELEKILKDSQYDMQERTLSILHEIESNVVAAKKDVRHHISNLMKN